nr:immunoglobulin heavy chain junction region [Mus musculus]MBK4197675.1 immunoglobulin heavy chain junction region [Mus musculus]MBK4197676.1 immunoglobulin heavy chain junction region [Mus musculus]MBK4197677.1 immunoglobulin heavy chain junction region [Mus musculus]MBK4197678.1 immunoglobulin heavy chain junction region [Mus musculus]
CASHYYGISDYFDYW